GLERIVYIGADAPAPLDGPRWHRYRQLHAAADRVSENDLDARGRQVGVGDVNNIQYTLGTTGFPKGVMLASRNIVNNGHALGRGLGFTPEDKLCLCVPLFHCFGCVIGVLGAFTHGAALCPIEWFDPVRVLATVERERCTA